jgi:capsular polysaccharide biosynthesis protein
MNSSDNLMQITLKGFFRVLGKRKISLIITFCIIFSLGLVYTFLVAPEYGLSSKIRISEDNIYYKSELYKFFPEEADDLWIIPAYEDEDDKVDYMVSKFESAPNEFKTDDILSAVIENTGSGLSKEGLTKSIDVRIDRRLATVTVTTYARDPELAYKMNKILLDEYINNKKKSLEEAYSSLLYALDIEIADIEGELDALSIEAEQSAVDFINRWQSELSNLNLDNLEIGFFDPIIAMNIEDKYNDYVFLLNTSEVMGDNKELFTDRIEVLETPEIYNVQDYSNYFRNILLSIATALVFGIVVAFIINHFKSSE